MRRTITYLLVWLAFLCASVANAQIVTPGGGGKWDNPTFTGLVNIIDGSLAFNGVPIGGVCPNGQYVNQMSSTGVLSCAIPAGGGGGGGNAILSNTPPPTPTNGMFWWDTVGAQLYVWTGSAWVIAVNLVGGGGGGGGGLPMDSPHFTGTMQGPTLNLTNTLTFNGTPLGGTCPAGEFVYTISSTGVPSCNATISGGVPDIGSTPPSGPTVGQLWYDTSSSPNVLKVWDGTKWDIVSNITNNNSGPTPPAGPTVGQLWYDTSASPPILRVWDGTAWAEAHGLSGGPWLPLAGGTLTGPLSVAGNVTLTGANNYVSANSVFASTSISTPYVVYQSAGGPAWLQIPGAAQALNFTSYSDGLIKLSLNTDGRLTLGANGTGNLDAVTVQQLNAAITTLNAAITSAISSALSTPTLTNPTLTGTITMPDGSTWTSTGITMPPTSKIQIGIVDITGTSPALTFNGIAIGGNCPADQYVNSISSKGVPSCGTPTGTGGGGSGQYAPLNNVAGGQNNYAPLSNAALTGTFTVNGQSFLTVGNPTFTGTLSGPTAHISTLTVPNSATFGIAPNTCGFDSYGNLNCVGGLRAASLAFPVGYTTTVQNNAISYGQVQSMIATAMPSGGPWTPLNTHAGITAPASPVNGQLWFDTRSDQGLKAWDGKDWDLVSHAGRWLPKNNPVYTGLMEGPKLKLGTSVPTLGTSQLLGMRYDANQSANFFIINGNANSNASSGLLFYNNASVGNAYTTYGAIQLNSTSAGGTGPNRFVLTSTTPNGIESYNSVVGAPFIWATGPSATQRNIMQVATRDPIFGTVLDLMEGTATPTMGTQIHLENNTQGVEYELLWINDNQNPDGIGGGTDLILNDGASGWNMIGVDTTNPDAGIGGWSNAGWWQFYKNPGHAIGGLSFEGSLGVGTWTDQVQGGPALGAVYTAYGKTFAPWGWGIASISNAMLSANGNWIADNWAHALINISDYNINFYSHASTTPWVQFNNWTLDGGINHTGWFVNHLQNNQNDAPPGIYCGDLAAGSRDTFGQAVAWPQCSSITLYFRQAYTGNSVCTASGNGQPWIWMPYNQGPTSVSFQCYVPWTGTGCSGSQWVQWHCAGMGG